MSDDDVRNLSDELTFRPRFGKPKPALLMDPLLEQESAPKLHVNLGLPDPDQEVVVSNERFVEELDKSPSKTLPMTGKTADVLAFSSLRNRVVKSGK